MKADSLDFLGLFEHPQIKTILDPEEKPQLICKVNKFNRFGFKQERTFLITNLSIFNLHKKKVQRKIPLDSIFGITKSSLPDSDEFVIHVNNEYDYRYISDKREKIIFVLIRILNLDKIKLYSVPQKNLSQYTTTKADVKNKNYKYPSSEYLLKLKPIVKINMSNKPEKSIVAPINENKPQLSDFVLLDLMKPGKNGSVYLAMNVKNDKVCAIKQFRKEYLESPSDLNKIQNDIFSKNECPFLVNNDYIFETEHCIYFIMKYYIGKDLFYVLKNHKWISEYRIRFYSFQICLSIGYLHENKVMYRNLKSENILIDEKGYIGLTDSSSSIIVGEDENKTTFFGTPEFMAPEIIKGSGYNTTADWWSLGILIYEMCYHETPFYNKNRNIMFKDICSKELEFPGKDKDTFMYSNELKDLIKKLLNKIPEHRLGFNGDSKEILNHSFFCGIEKSQILNKKLEAQYVPDPLPENFLDNFSTRMIDIKLSEKNLK